MVHDVTTISTQELAYDVIHSTTSSRAIVDVRPQYEYNGWNCEKLQRRGHILGARNLPLSWVMNQSGYVNCSLQHLRQILGDKKITKEKKVILYGAPQNRLEILVDTLTQLDYRNVAIYAEGISKWASDLHLPMEILPNYSNLVPVQIVKQLVDTGCAATLEKATWKIFEISWGGSLYHTGHIPTAYNLHTGELEEPPMWNKKPDETLNDVLLSQGITSETTVILYDRQNLAAARAALIMLYCGVNDVRIIDGGMTAWCVEKYPLQTSANIATPEREFGAPVPLRPEIIYDRAQVKEIINKSDANLVSIRTWEEYIGKTSGYSYIRKKGCIPGSTWGHGGTGTYRIEHFRNPDNTFRSYKEIESIWEEWGISRRQNNCYFCGTGWRASEAFFAAMLMAWPSISVYDGGWLEWSTFECSDEDCTPYTKSECRHELTRGNKFTCEEKQNQVKVAAEI